MLLYFFFVFLVSYSSHHFVKQREKKLDKMWNLANELGLTSSDLSQLSGIGQIDLENSKQKEGRYLPPSKIIKKTTFELEKIKNKADTFLN